MAKYSLQPTEAVLLVDEGVAHGSTLASYTSKLTLTNLNLVLEKKGLLGNSKGVHVFPLSQVKVYDGHAQALIGKKSNGRPALEVYFMNGQELFDFQSGGKKKILTWTARINTVVTGQDSPAGDDPGKALPGAGLVAGVLKDTVGVFKTTFGSKMDEPVQAAGKCRACSAPISGTRGLAITCGYCGTSQEL